MRAAYAAMLVLGATVLAGCSDSSAQGAAAAPPPPEVAVVAVHARNVPLVRRLVGRLAATRVAEVRARVAGIILRRTYTEGTDVREGQELFQIDPAPLRAELHGAEAALASARANAANTALIVQRYRRLEARKLLSKQDLDTALASARSAAAAVKEAQAKVETARLNLGYATVTAPISGRAGNALVTEGALVGQGSPTQLTTIEQIDPIYVNFGEPVAEYERQRAAADAARGGAGAAPTVEVILPDGKRYPHAGRVDFTDLNVDPSTGTVLMRAVLPNPGRRLLPGMFVHLRVTAGRVAGAFLIPQAALARDARGAYVLLVGPGGKVLERRVHTHGMTRTDWIVTGDLHDGERVIVEGLQKVHPGGRATTTAFEPHPANG